MTIRLQREPFDAASEASKLTRGRTDVGAVVTFTGICRGDESGARLVAMTLEHYPDMAEAEIARHVEEAEQRWPLKGVTVIHRHGRLVPGDNIVLVVTAAAWIASYAVGRLISLNRKVEAAGGRLALCSLTPVVTEIIDIMQLRRLLQIYGTEQEALQSFLHVPPARRWSPGFSRSERRTG